MPMNDPIPLKLMDDGFWLWTKGMDLKVSDSFTANEFACHCNDPACQTQKVSSDLVTRLQTLRNALGSPIRVTSGYRCQAYQDALRAKGYETAAGVSQHTLGQAADIQPVDMRLMSGLLQYVKEQFADNGIGVATRFIHCDVRKPPGARWNYKTL